jgi:RNA polymerase subunit RPABC4/transcription elongation factor Spt4
VIRVEGVASEDRVGAAVVDKQDETAFKRCPECFEIVPYRVRICPSCSSYQDWRRYLSIGQTNLALIVALISVLTSLVTVANPLLKPRNADIALIHETSTSTVSAFLARNDGRSGGILRLEWFELGFVDKNKIGLLQNFAHAGVFVEASKEQRFEITSFELSESMVKFHLSQRRFFEQFGTIDPTANPYLLSLRHPRLDAMLAALKCSFTATESGFYAEPVRKEFPTSCKKISSIWGVLVQMNGRYK